MEHYIPAEPFIPYYRHQMTEDDVQAVVDTLRSDWLSQGPAVVQFEEALAEYVGAREAIAVSSGTASRQLALLAAGVGPGDRVIVPSNAFVSSANAVLQTGASPCWADVEPETGLIAMESVAGLLEKDHNRRIKAVMPLHFAGQPADLAALYPLVVEHGAALVDDASQALGAEFAHEQGSSRVGQGTHSDFTIFSFHPGAHVTTGEGGAVATNKPEAAESIRLLRNQALKRTGFEGPGQVGDNGGCPRYYEAERAGFNFRLSEPAAAMGRSQLLRLPQTLEKRCRAAERYMKLLKTRFPDGQVRPLSILKNSTCSWGLFVMLADFGKGLSSRGVVMNRLRRQGIASQVHFSPLHRQPFYRRLVGETDLPGTDKYYGRTLTLPLFPDLTVQQQERIVDELERSLSLSYQPADAGTRGHNR